MKRYLSITTLTSLVLTAALVLGAAAFTPTKASAATLCTQRVLQEGSNNSCVPHLKAMLNKLTGSKLTLTNTQFGPLTKKAVIAWQADRQKSNKKMLVDGVVGPQTWGSLCAVQGNFVDAANKVGCNQPPTPCSKRTFSVQSRLDAAGKDCVNVIRQMLNHRVNAGLGATGLYNKDVAAQAIALQKIMRQNDATIKVDGIVGKQTWKALCAFSPEKESPRIAYTNLRESAGCAL